MDPSEQAFRLAGKRLGEVPFPVEFVATTAEDMNFAAGSFDAAVLTWTLCSVHSPALSLRNIRRVLKPDGRLFLLEHGLLDERPVQRFQLFGPRFIANSAPGAG